MMAVAAKCSTSVMFVLVVIETYNGKIKHIVGRSIWTVDDNDDAGVGQLKHFCVFSCIVFIPGPAERSKTTKISPFVFDERCVGLQIMAKAPTRNLRLSYM